MAELFEPDFFLRVGVDGRAGLRRAPGRDGLLPLRAGDDSFLREGLAPGRDLAGDLPPGDFLAGDFPADDEDARAGDLPPGLLADLGGDWRPDTPAPGRLAVGDALGGTGRPGWPD